MYSTSRATSPAGSLPQQRQGPSLPSCAWQTVTLNQHAVNWAARLRTDEHAANAHCPITSGLVATVDRRLDAQPVGAIALVYNPAYSAGYALDLYCANIEDGCPTPMMSGRD